MNVRDLVILAGALVLTGLLAWNFFGPKKSRQAQLGEGVQIIKVTVKGGYSPRAPAKSRFSTSVGM